MSDTLGDFLTGCRLGAMGSVGVPIGSLAAGAALDCLTGGDMGKALAALVAGASVGLTPLLGLTVAETNGTASFGITATSAPIAALAFYLAAHSIEKMPVPAPTVSTASVQHHAPAQK